MTRITESRLNSACAALNQLSNSPLETYRKTTPAEYITTKKKYISQIGNFYISSAYGGVSLHRIIDNNGGIKDVFGCGHVLKRELWNRIENMVLGIEVLK